VVLNGSDVGNYFINTPQNAVGTITKRPLILGGITAVDKVYDGTTSAAVKADNYTLNGLLGGDDVKIDLSRLSSTFKDAHAGPSKTVNITGIELLGQDSKNYELDSKSIALTANVTPASITAVNNLKVKDKIYDGTTNQSSM